MGDKQADDKDKRVKIQAVEGELEAAGETDTKRKKRFQMPNVPRWWQNKIIEYAFAHPHVRARLEKHMGSNLVKLTDKQYMTELEDRIRDVAEEGLNKRISSRVMDEMERLKRLILIGKTPLKDCPPELYHHPVFIFWRMVNKEVAKASKKRQDAFLRKLRKSQKVQQSTEEEAEPEAESEPAEPLTPEQLIARTQRELAEQRTQDVQRGFCFTDELYAQLKFETNDVRTLKTLNTVEELYSLSDKIIGNKRV